MTAWFQSWGISYEWSWFIATLIGILVIALPRQPPQQQARFR